MALQSPGDVQGSELSGMRSTCLLGFNEPLVLFSDNFLAEAKQLLRTKPTVSLDVISLDMLSAPFFLDL